MILDKSRIPDPRKPITLKLSSLISWNFSGSSLDRLRESEAGKRNFGSEMLILLSLTSSMLIMTEH